MLKILSLFLIVVVCLVLANCGKTKFNIGHDAPEMELQKCMKLSENKKFEEAIECLEIFKSKFPQSTYASEAELAIADSHFKQKEYLLAADSYMAFLKLHPASSKADYAHFRLGLSYLKETPKAIDRDQEYMDEAVQYLKMAIVGYPESPYRDAAVESLKNARDRIARRLYYIGRFYCRNGEYIAAIPRFLDLVNDFPESSLAPRSLYDLVVASGKLQRVGDAKIFYSKLSMDYPNSEWTKKAEEKLSGYVSKYGAGEEKQAPAP